MRYLSINGILADIDDQTVIGVDFQTYDIKEPARMFVNVSNNFSIPKTINNLSIFGFSSNPQSISLNAYNLNLCRYYVNNEIILNDSKIKIEYIDERINLLIYDKAEIWDQLKNYMFSDLTKDLVLWLQSVGRLESEANKWVGNCVDFVSKYLNALTGVKLSLYFGNFLDYKGASPRADTLDNLAQKAITLTESANTGGSHWSVYCKTIFEFLEFKFGVSFLVNDTTQPGNIFNDPIGAALYIPIPKLILNTITYSNATANYPTYFKLNNEVIGDPGFYPYQPLTDQFDKPAKTAFDFVDSFIKHLNIIKDEIYINNTKHILFARFDDLKTLAPVINWSGRLSGDPVFAPFIENIAQSNIIKFTNIFPEGSGLANSKLITCQNKNIDARNDELISIGSYIPGVFNAQADGFILDLSIKEAFETFVFLIDGQTTVNNWTINQYHGVTFSALYTGVLKAAQLYSLNSEYNFYNEICQYPKRYKIKKWISSKQIKSLKFFAQYFIKELNGSYFINKISGYNPEKSLQPVEIDLIYLSSKVGNITLQRRAIFWADGADDLFVDGSGNFYVTYEFIEP